MHKPALTCAGTHGDLSAAMEGPERSWVRLFFRVTSERLLKAGFQLEKLEDGTFWVMEREAGEEADRLLRICGKALVNFDAEAVEELILLQCGSDLSDPQLYIDGFLWDLTKRDLADIVFLLARGGQPKPPPAQGKAGTRN